MKKNSVSMATAIVGNNIVNKSQETIENKTLSGIEEGSLEHSLEHSIQPKVQISSITKSYPPMVYSSSSSDEEDEDSSELLDDINEVENIWRRAKIAFDLSPDDKDVLNPFIQELTKYNVYFDDAYRLDKLYFNCEGSYWRAAYKNPHLWDIVMDDSIVTQCGLATFSVDYYDEDYTSQCDCSQTDTYGVEDEETPDEASTEPPVKKSSSISYYIKASPISSEDEDEEEDATDSDGLTKITDMNAVETIYSRAKIAFDTTPFDKDVLTPFIQELDKYSICFDDANRLDSLHFNCNGGYWREAYNNPHPGDCVLDGEVVTKIGLLTFDIYDEANFYYKSEEYDTDDYLD